METAERWDDTADQWQEAIDNAHRTKTGKHKTYEKALEMVSNRHSKGALVDLVNWLLAYRSPEIPWQSMESAPMDGTPFYVRYKTPMRFKPYSHKSQEYKRGFAGRWQIMNEHGGWDNTEFIPYEWQPHDMDAED